MRQIIALGGGGFSMEPDNPLLDLYILKQAKKTTPKICFIPTASGDSDIYISRYYNFFNKQNCNPSHLSLFKPPTRGFRGVFTGEGYYICWWRKYKKLISFMERVGVR
jgi:dipeptidase E